MPQDVLTIEATGVGGNATIDFNFEDWTSFSLRTSMVEPAELSLELGDDTGWTRLNALVALGAQFQVFVNERPRMRGRVEAIDAPGDAEGSTSQRLVIRTKLSDALYSSAPQKIRLKGVSLKQFVLACYSSLGLTEADFDFRGDVSRDLMTGKPSRGGRAPRDIDSLKEETAKVNPPETIFAAVDRHLRRHGFLHWDGADGKIVVAAPDDQQDPIYYLQSYKATNLAQINNIKACQRIFDVSEAPTVLGMYGKGGNVDFAKTKIGQVLFNQSLIDAGFSRTIILVDEGLRNSEHAARRAAHEFSTRNRGLERLLVSCDGLSYREGAELVPFVSDTVADVSSDAHGGALGTFYVETVQSTRDVAGGDNTQLMMVRQGTWQL